MRNRGEYKSGSTSMSCDQFKAKSERKLRSEALDRANSPGFILELL
jgi:hypothetical protein